MKFVFRFSSQPAPRFLILVISAKLALSQAAENPRKIKIMNYSIKASAGKIAAALAKLCAQGDLGESLVLNGVSQDAFALFLARVAARYLIEKNKSAEELADIFSLLSGGNASAARQALGGCTLEIEGEKPVSISAYWMKQGGGKAAPNLSALD